MTPVEKPELAVNRGEETMAAALNGFISHAAARRVSGSASVLPAVLGVDAQFAQVPPFPRPGLVQVLITCPNRCIVSESRSRSMGISQRDSVCGHNPSRSTGCLQRRRLHFGKPANAAPNVVCCEKPFSFGQRVMDFSEVDAANDRRLITGQEPVEFSQGNWILFCVPHYGPCVEHNPFGSRGQRSDSQFSEAIALEGSYSLMMPSRARSWRVPG